MGAASRRVYGAHSSKGGLMKPAFQMSAQPLEQPERSSFMLDA
jgi:hypothetical protein